MFLGNGIRYRQNSDGYPYIFDPGLINGDVADIARRQTTSVIQDGGLQTGSTMSLWNGMRHNLNSHGNPGIFDQSTNLYGLCQHCPTSADFGFQNGGLYTFK